MMGRMCRASESLVLVLALVCASSSFRVTPTVVRSKPGGCAVFSSAGTQPPVETSRKVSPSDCDDSNIPPSLSALTRSILSLPSGSDIRGRYLPHSSVGSISRVSRAIRHHNNDNAAAPLTPFAAFCYGHAFATLLLQRTSTNTGNNAKLTICVGRDPRIHGVSLADAVCRGIQTLRGVRTLYTGIATTPAMLEFCRAGMCDGAIMITASHHPPDRNGMKFFTQTLGSVTKRDVTQMAHMAASYATHWHDLGTIPHQSGSGVCCSRWVDYMPHYVATLREALRREIPSTNNSNNRPLEGLRIVLNAGNGSGAFFGDVLSDLGADMSHSMNVTPVDGTFPAGVPNPESPLMMEATLRACRDCRADLGILLDTDADRSGFVLFNSETNEHEPLNRNRLIALLGVIFSIASPGCTIVTDSVTSEGLSKFLTSHLRLTHVRYLKGYANVIEKAKEITNNSNGGEIAEMAIETSGHCAMRENGYSDDGTYTAIKIIGLLARVRRQSSSSAADGGGSGNVLSLISELREMKEIMEFRIHVRDGSISSTMRCFHHIVQRIEYECGREWRLDTENLEGIRVRTSEDGGFFMVRPSLHDPLICFQVEGNSRDEVKRMVISPILNHVLQPEENDCFTIRDVLDLTPLDRYMVS